MIYNFGKDLKGTGTSFFGLHRTNNFSWRKNHASEESHESARGGRAHPIPGHARFGQLAGFGVGLFRSGRAQYGNGRHHFGQICSPSCGGLSGAGLRRAAAVEVWR